jgi:hypothetical protein
LRRLVFAWLGAAGRSPRRREEGAAAITLLIYTSCYGRRLHRLMLFFIRKFMHIFDSPLYTHSTVTFTMLFLVAGRRER